MPGTSLRTSSAKSAMRGVRIDSKIERTCLSAGKVKLIMLKRLCRRSEITLRPPPGGPMATTSCMSAMKRQDCLARSYQPP